MSTLTVHQQAVLTVINRSNASPVQMSSVVSALPQYTKQQTAMIVGSLCMRDELVVSTTAMPTVAELTEEAVLQFLRENADRTAALLNQLNEPVMTAQEKIEECFAEARRSKEPLIYGKFCEEMLVKYGTTYPDLTEQLIRYYHARVEGSNIMGRNTIHAELRYEDERLAVGADWIPDFIDVSLPFDGSYDSLFARCSYSKSRYFREMEWSFASISGQVYHEELLRDFIRETHDALFGESSATPNPVYCNPLYRPNPCEVFGFDESEEFTKIQLKTAFRKLAMQHHPDRGGETSTMQYIQEVYGRLLSKCKH